MLGAQTCWEPLACERHLCAANWSAFVLLCRGISHCGKFNTGWLDSAESHRLKSLHRMVYFRNETSDECTILSRSLSYGIADFASIASISAQIVPSREYCNRSQRHSELRWVSYTMSLVQTHAFKSHTLWPSRIDQPPSQNLLLVARPNCKRQRLCCKASTTLEANPTTSTTSHLQQGWVASRMGENFCNTKMIGSKYLHWARSNSKWLDTPRAC